MAEGAGFEPAIRFPAYTLSRRAPSTTRPPLRSPHSLPAGPLSYKARRISARGAIPSILFAHILRLISELRPALPAASTRSARSFCVAAKIFPGPGLFSLALLSGIAGEGVGLICVHRQARDDRRQQGWFHRLGLGEQTALQIRDLLSRSAGNCAVAGAFSCRSARSIDRR